jgi:hypothetical protein
MAHFRLIFTVKSVNHSGLGTMEIVISNAMAAMAPG